MNVASKPAIALIVGAVVVLSAISTPAIPAADDPSKDVDKLLIIDCMLPGKILRLGGGARYMSARRPIRTTGADCEIRGGEYIAYDRASYASSLNVWLPEAKAGDAKAQTYVGEMFEQGLGTTPDYATAVVWYRKAAEQGFERAQMNLGSMYERGLGVEKNELEALNWYRKATGLVDDDLVLGSEAKALEAEAAGLREALAKSEAEVRRLQESLTLSQRQMNNSQARLDNIQLELEELRFRASQAQSGGARTADVAAMNEQIRNKETELQASREELMELRLAFDRQQAQFAAQLSAQDNGKDSYQALLDVERERIRTLESQVDQLTGNLASRQAELNSSNSQLAALRRQLDAQAANDQAATASSVAELSEIIAAQQGTLEQKSHDINALESELARQKQQLAAEQSAMDERQKNLQAGAASSSEQQQAALAQERLRIATLQGEVANKSRELELKQAGLDQSNAQLEVLNRQLELANSKQAHSEESMAELSQIIAAQQSDLEQKSLSISYLEQELTNQKQQLSAERQAYNQREKRLLENVDMAAAEQQSLQTRLQAIESSLSSSQQKLVESDRQIERQEAEILQQQAAIAQLKDDQQQSNSTAIRALEAKLGEKNIELAQARGENTGLLNAKQEMERELDRLRSQVAMTGGGTAVAMRGAAKTLPEPKHARTKIPGVDFGNYYALIIGNDNYVEFPSLETPINDAQSVAAILRDRYGFKTEVVLNADRKAMLEAINNYRKRLTEDDNFLLYYAGHGELDKKNGRGYWLPVDAGRESTTQWISIEQVTDHINAMSATHIMVIADSCYSGTLTRGIKVNLEGGKSEKMEIKLYKELARIRSRSAMTSGGTKPVQDGGGDGQHSIFANNLLQALIENTGILQGWELHLEVFKRVRSSGQNVIGQEPTFDVIQNTGDLGAPFFFVPG
jgi:hypothetical protein